MVGGLLGLLGGGYRKIFPSYDWDEDVWRVNTILNMPVVMGKNNAGFVKNVPNEEVKRGDYAVKRWIDEHMVGCSCLVVFVGEKTYQSKWVRYEMETALDRGMGFLMISLKGVKNRYSEPCRYPVDPYIANNLHRIAPMRTYKIRTYRWIEDDGLHNIGAWIEDACIRAGK